jgi:hypothetical protein
MELPTAARNEALGFEALGLEALASGDLVALVQRAERLRRQAEVAVACGLAELGRRGVHLDDGHVDAAAWGRATFGWSMTESKGLLRLGRVLGRLPSVRSLAEDGRVGLAHLATLGDVERNPRCREQVGEVDELFGAQVLRLRADEFAVLVRPWVAAVDSDGAARSQQSAHRRRSAHLVRVGDETVLRAQGAAWDGAVLGEVFDRFCEAEFLTDWAAARQQVGADLARGFLPRTDAQRRFDAVVAIFAAAASAPGVPRSGEPLVNVVVDARTAAELLAEVAGLESARVESARVESAGLESAGVGPAGIGPASARVGGSRLPGGGSPPRSPDEVLWRRCETVDGVQLPRADVLAALLVGQLRRVVLDSAGRVIDLGRRSRLFRGGAREAVLLLERRCLWPGCNAPPGRLQADHLHGWAFEGGRTDHDDGGPACGHHNLVKRQGYSARRDEHGGWHVYRPDGTEITRLDTVAA